MSKEICISSTPHETRLAILEDDQLTEVYYERENEYTLAGSIYKGRVTRVLPGMQSAFVDLGLERDAFLYVTDFMEEQEDSSDFERIPSQRPARGGTGSRTAGPGEPRTTAAACRRRRRGRSSTAQRRPGKLRVAQHPARGRQASLRMVPGAGEAAVAAARAFAHLKAGRHAAQEQTGSSPQRWVIPYRGRGCRASCTGGSRARGHQSHSLFLGSRFPSTAARVLPRRPPCRSTAAHPSSEPMSSSPSPRR